MRRAIKAIDYWLENIALTAFAASIIIMFFQIIMRYVFHSGFVWAEELSRLLFVWIVYLGVPIAIRKFANIEVDYFVRYLNNNVQKKLKVSLYVFSAAFSFIIAFLGAIMVIENHQMFLRSLPISKAFQYLPLMLGFLMMGMNFIRVLPSILHDEENVNKE